MLLETTSGRVIGRLVGYTVGPPQNLTGEKFGRSVGVDALAAADPGLTVLFDRAGHAWRLDTTKRRLTRVGALQAPLAGGAEIKVVLEGQPSSGWNTKTVITRQGETLLEGSEIGVIDGRFAADLYDLDAKPTHIVDLVTGRRQRLPGRCAAVGVVRSDVIVTCIPEFTAQPSSLRLVRPDGSVTVLTKIVPGVEPTDGWVSPNGKWVLLYLQPNCGLGWAAIASTTGGLPRFAAGGGTVSDQPRSILPPFSDALGWTSASQAVVTISTPTTKNQTGCMGAPSNGTYVVNPGTLARHRSTAAIADELWDTDHSPA